MTDIEKSAGYIAWHKKETIDNIIKFFVTDMLFFWSANPELKQKQTENWLPLLQKLNDNFGFNLKYSENLIPADNAENSKIFAKVLNNMSDDELAVCFLAATQTKSTMIGLMMAKSMLSAEEAFKQAYLEEIFQNEYWGVDEEEMQKRQKTKEELRLLEKFLQK